MPHSTHGTVVLMGSGEMAPSMVEVHKYAMSLVEGPVRAVFADTPAGFQLNAALLGEKAQTYFQERLNTELEVVTFRDAGEATREEMQHAVDMLRKATYIFAGPGSPTYAIRNWRHTPVLDAISETLADGGCLTFASAASLTLGRLTIPVYEIYKVGSPIHWVEGLDILGHTGLDVTVVPHWNNTSGGDHDTRFCFMGEPRWQVLEAQLPLGTAVLGMDEHTACILRLHDILCEVRGVGEVVVRRDGETQTFANGDSFSLDLLRAREDSAPTRPESTQPESQPAPTWQVIQAKHEALLKADRMGAEPVKDYVFDLMRLMSTARERGDWQNMRQAEEALRGVLVNVVGEMDAGPGDVDGVIEPYVSLLLDLRNSLREEKQWAQADQIRDGLQDAGIIIEDHAEGSSWRRNSE